MRIPTFYFKHSETAENDINIGFCNLMGYKFFSRYITAKKAIKRWAKEKTSEQKVLLSYALTTPFCQLCDYVKKRFPKIKVCVVVPDLPDYMKDGGRVILSGIIGDRVDEIRAAVLARGLSIVREESERDWFAILAEKV